jgi:hypothetical protein
MFHRYKLLALTALLSPALISCSDKAAQTQPAPNPAAAESTAEAAAKIDTAAIEAAELKAKDEAKLKADADAQRLADRAEKEAAARAEAQVKEAQALEAQAQEAQAAKIAADAKAEKQALARAESQARIAKEQQAEKDAAAQRQVTERQAEAAELARAKKAAQEQAAAIAAAQNIAAAPQATSDSEAKQDPAPVPAANPNAPYNAFLSKYVSPSNGINLVAYDKVTAADRAVLKAYIDRLSAMDIESLPREAEMAAWFNLYNAKTIELILENYPLKSIRKIRSPWKKDRLIVNGKKMSLDDIEHGTVRKKYDEPRVHYAFNCASIGCPNVKTSAWEAASLDADLTQAARDFIASERGVSVEGNKIIASSIFKWYKKDFGGSEAGILAHLRQYATGAKKAALEAAGDIDKYDYDWDLNIR